MSGQVKLGTPAGGNAILAAPNSATDYTLTLPSGDVSLASTVDAGAYNSFKNRIINGDMRIDQRNAGASVTITTDGQYGSCDRWAYDASQSSKFSVQQVGTVPSAGGFSKSMLITSLAATTVGTNDYYTAHQKIEGFNVADLAWGTAAAKPVTVSFWVACSVTGTFGGAITNAAYNRSYPFTYTITSSATYQYVSVTIPGDTSGTWATDNTVGLNLQFDLGTGSGKRTTAGSWASGWYMASGAQSLVATNGATFYITGVQLEKGSTATAFDYRPYGTELALCQRYYEWLYGDSVTAIAILSSSLSGPNSWATWYFKQNKRAVPTVGLGTGTSWITATPSISPSISSVNFNNNTSLFYAQNGIGVYASSEL